jgi:FkbM family methyltransferase
MPQYESPLARAIATKQILRRKATLLFQQGMGLAGKALPLSTKMQLAQKSSKLAHLLLHDGDVEFTGYLGNCHMWVNARYPSERAIICNRYEEDLAHVVEQFVKPGSICLDIGASSGTVAMLLAKKVAPSGKVFAFEPGPSLFSRLERNVQSNPNLHSIFKLQNVGLSNQVGTLFFKEDAEFPGNAYLWANKGESVPVIRLDDFMEKEGISEIGFMKIDVEGMEWEVLDGARETLKRDRPIVFFETLVHHEVFRNIPVVKKSAELLMNLNYELFSVDSGGKHHPVAYPHFTQNTLALPK